MPCRMGMGGCSEQGYAIMPSKCGCPKWAARDEGSDWLIRDPSDIDNDGLIIALITYLVMASPSLLYFYSSLRLVENFTVYA